MTAMLPRSKEEAMLMSEVGILLGEPVPGTFMGLLIEKCETGGSWWKQVKERLNKKRKRSGGWRLACREDIQEAKEPRKMTISWELKEPQAKKNFLSQKLGDALLDSDVQIVFSCYPHQLCSILHLLKSWVGICHTLLCSWYCRRWKIESGVQGKLKWRGKG